MSVSKTTTKFGLPLPQPGDKPDWYDVGAVSQQIENLAGAKNGFATLDANGNAVQMPVNAVPQTRTIAGLDLSKDRTLTELTAAGLAANNPNLLINGDFKVNQRGLEQYEYGYGFDRWVNVFTNANLISQVTRGMYNGNGGKYSIRISILSVSNSDGNNFAQPIEDSANGMSCFAGQTVTFSISASTSSNCSYRCMYIGYKETPTATNMTYKITAIPALGGNRYSVTATLPITACKVECGIGATRSINATDANSYIDIWDAKLEIGSVATPFSPRPYAEELALCQRYYQKINLTDKETLGIFMSSSDGGEWMVPISVEMRLAGPTLSTTGNFSLIPDGTISPLPFVSAIVRGGCAYIWTSQGANSVAKYVATIGSGGASLSLDAEIY